MRVVERRAARSDSDVEHPQVCGEQEAFMARVFVRGRDCLTKQNAGQDSSGRQNVRGDCHMRGL